MVTFHEDWFEKPEDTRANPRSHPGIQQYLKELRLATPPSEGDIPDQWKGEMPDDYTLKELEHMVGDTLFNKLRRTECE